MSSSKPPVTALLHAWSQGDRAALDELTPLVYGELRRLAAAYVKREGPERALSPTELVSEAFLKLVGGEHPEYAGRVQFFAVAARHMRRILVDHARRRLGEKRGGGALAVTLDELMASSDRPAELCALDDAIEALAAVDERKARVVELHYFGGLAYKEIASLLGVHENTVLREVRLAEAWLSRHIQSPT